MFVVPSVGLYSLSHGGYGSYTLLQYVITANKAHNTENMATIAFNIHIKIEPMALCPKTVFIVLFFTPKYTVNCNCSMHLNSILLRIIKCLSSCAKITI